MTYVLDRFEEDYVIFVGDDESILTLSADGYREYREGDVFIGEDLRYDPEETARRREATRERFRKLHRRGK
jgi:hypothetical protein